MTIVQVGTLTLQVKGKGTRWESLESLMAQIEEQVRQVVARCIEEALDAEVDTLLKRGLCLLVGDGAASRPRLLSEDTSGLLASFVPIARWSANSALVADA